MTLKEILCKRYDELKKLNPITSDFNTFYNNESRKLTDIFSLLQLDEWTEKLKSNGEYNFSQKGADFVLRLFDEYSGKEAKLDAIRRLDLRKFDAAFVDYLCQECIEMFREAGASPEELAQIEVRLQGRLFMDFYRARAQYNRTKARLDEFFKVCVIDNPSDCMEFLQYFALEFERISDPFIERMKGLAEAMCEIRWEEVVDDDRLQKEVESISQEEIMRDDLAVVYAEKIDKAMTNDEELKRLRQEYVSVQKPDAKKPPFVNETEKTVRALVANIQAREEKIRKHIIEEEHTKTLRSIGKLKENERFTLPIVENPYTPSSEDILSSRDVLLRALDRLKEDDENLENDEVTLK